jgi:hypothetical protein
VNSAVMKMRFSHFCDVTQRRFVVTDVSRPPVASVFKGQAVQVENCLTLEDGTDRFFRNLDYESTLRNIPEERRSDVHRGGSLRSRIDVCCFKEYESQWL